MEMFKTVHYKKINFLKNITSKCGAQDSVLESIADNEVCIHIQNKRNGKLWGATTENHLLTIINTNIGAYEVIIKYPHKAYFYIDCVNGSKLDTFKSIILVHIPDAKLSISGSETSIKNSYHITVNNYTINNIIERENFKHFVVALHAINNGFDIKVYTNNRNMKIINQSKPDDERIQKIIEDDEAKNHLITCFINNGCKSVSSFVNQYIKEKSKKNKRVNLLSLPNVEVNIEDADTNDLKNPLTLLKLLPINKEFDHKYTFMVARFCYKNGINFNNFFNWYTVKQKMIQMKKEINGLDNGIT